MADFDETLGELTQLVADQAGKPDLQDHIHCAWLCVHEDGRRVEAAEENLCRELAHRMPVLGVITKARSDGGFRAEVQRLLPKAKNVCRVRAKREELDGGHVLPPMGLKDLVASTFEVLPEGIRGAFTAAQKVSLEHKKQQAHRVVGSAATSAAAVAVVPIPFADAALLVPIQISMLAGISVMFGLDVSRTFLSVLVATATGGTASTLAGRFIVANLLKSIPGAGTILGGTVSATTAATLTIALGEIYIASLVAVYTRTHGEVPDMKAVEEEFDRQIEAAKDGSMFENVKSKARELLGSGE